MNKKFLSLILTTATLATIAFSSSALQRNGNLQITQYHHVLITGDDVRHLPSGENRIVQKIVGGNSNASVPTGSVIFTVDGIDKNTSVNLSKTGAGTLILPNANTRGVTKVGPGALQNTTTHTLTKELTGTLILASSNDVIYEFRDLGPTELEQILVPFEQAAGRLSGLKKVVEHSRPAEAMKGWPFKRLLLGPATGVAQVEGWQPAAISGNATPGSKSVCTGGFCGCSGAADCLSLANSSSCSSDMNCDGSGSSARCYCKTK